MKIKVTRPDGGVVWEAVYMDGTVGDLDIRVGTDGQLNMIGVPPDHAIHPPWKLEIVPGSGEDNATKAT